MIMSKQALLLFIFDLRPTGILAHNPYTTLFRSDSPDDIGAAPLVHVHAVTDVTGLQAALDSKVDDSQVGANSGLATLDSGGRLPSGQLTAHGHAIADVTGLQTALDGKEATGAAASAVGVHDADSGAHSAIQ